MLAHYRPVSLTSVCCKILEHIVVKNMREFFEQNDLLCCFQHGFRSGLSNVTQLIETIHDLCVAVDACVQIDVICIDYVKAFDRVSLQKLLFKLRNVGINEDVLNWIRAYLSDRQQAVRVGDTLSGNCEVYSGVPQYTIGAITFPFIY